MQFTAMDEDDVDFTVSENARSRLSSLFQNNNSSSSDINEALTFTAPKQPKKTDNAQTAPGTLKLLHAVIVHAYKLKDGSYTNQGKLGCAVLGHHETHSYKLLLYKGKQIQVTIVSITPSFVFHVQPNNYANFYDQKKENWSINFDSETALFDFTKQVALAKANCQSPMPLILQDLVKGEGQPLENGDAAELKYSGWLLSDCTFGQMFDSNMNSESLFRVRLGKGKVIKGWNDGLVGMQKGGKRLLIIPPNLAYGAEGMGTVIPPNSSLIFEVHIVKVKSGRESSNSPSSVKITETTSDKKPDVPPRQSFSQEDNIKIRGASISEQLSQSPKKDKAQLISRMAKMGTATLPFQGAIAAHVSSDSESESEPLQPSSPAPQPSSPAPQNTSRTSSPKAFNKSRSQTNSEPVVSSQIVQPEPIQTSIPYHVNQRSSQMSFYAQSMMPSQQPFVCAATPFSAYQQQIPGQFSVPSLPSISGYIPPVSSSIADSHFSLLMTETRSQNSEVRMSLSKIADKVETVIQKVDDLNLQRRVTNANMPLMESAIILQNIERIIQENKQLKEDNEIKASKIQSLNEIICDLFQRNQRFSEENTNILGQKNELLQATADQSQEKISNLEQEKTKLQLELSSVSSKLNKLESDVLKYQKIENDLNQKLEEMQRENKAQMDLINEGQEKLNENKTVIKSLQEKLQDTEHEKELLNMKLQSIEEEHSKTQGSSDLIDIYKREIQDYKEKIECLNVEISNSIPAAQFEEMKQNMGRELAEITSSKDKYMTEVKEMKKKIDFLEEQKLSYEDKIRRLESEVENAQLLKRKFEVFQEKTRALKETYETQIVQLMNEIKHLKNTVPATSPEFAVEIKRVMNRLYKLLQGKFESGVSYTGSEVLQTVLQTIMAITFKILETKTQSSEDHADINESSKKVVPKKEITTDESQNEISQQNGLNELKVEAVPVSEESVTNSVLSNFESSDKDLNTVTEIKNEEESKENVESAVESEFGPTVNIENDTKPIDELDVKVEESIVNKDDGDVKHNDQLKIEVNESIKRESPESNMPSSNLFSELLSGTDGTKIWRQPPPLFDDDDDDDDDDDWLK